MKKEKQQPKKKTVIILTENQVEKLIIDLIIQIQQ